jgi:Zn-dependent M28 family amino/carboxypeptidase
VTVDGILQHEHAFQAIADDNDDNRASGTAGYDASAAYVIGRLDPKYYDVTVQPFTFPFFQELAPTTFSQTAPAARTYQDGTDFAIMEYSGSGSVLDKAVVPTNDVLIPPGPTASSSNSGCEAADFAPASATEHQVALIQRGTCNFVVKAQNAQAAGYDAAIIFNEGQEGRTEVLNGTLGGPGVTIPVIGTTFAVGEELFLASEARASISTSTRSETRQTSNVIAETKTGRSDRVAFAGAHLDSVPEGPGINDNGSGSATILEVAEEMGDLGITPRNKVRFAFWGAEESGLLGAEYYVSKLGSRQQKDIAVYLNFDMVGSPNYGRFIYDGDGSATPDAGPNGSATAEKIFEEYFASRNLATLPTAFDGRSDYGPFIEAGIPAGGLFTGAEDVKSAQEAALFGGVAGYAFDPCYHSPCDSFTPVADGADRAAYQALATAYGANIEGNLNKKALDEMSDATAHAVLTFALTTSAVNGTEKGSGGPTADFEYEGSHVRK